MKSVTGLRHSLFYFTFMVLALSWTTLSEAQFVGPYALTPPNLGLHTIYGGNPQVFGDWTLIAGPPQSTPPVSLYVETGTNGLSLDTGLKQTSVTAIFFAQV
ncbi:MAG TPA: hypothetical protein VG146_21555 [Verrucomicrobiae bacterium]|nr:hypothetical protein [Verrucomicrobiae bacterium]